MPQTTFAGHPLHPQLISAPVGLLPFSLVLDVMHLATGKQSYADAAYYTLMGGTVGGLAAGAAGAADYFAIPPYETEVKKIANLHALLNVGLMGVYGLNLLLRRGRRPNAVGILPVLLSALGTAGLIASSWYGGSLVYDHGMRVKGISPIGPARDLKLPGDEKLEEAFVKFEERFAPAEGLTGQPQLAAR